MPAEEEFTLDIEGAAALDAPDEPEPFEFWKEKQRDLVVSVVDYNLQTLSDLITVSKVIDLKPEYQRRDRWDAKKQSALIESFLINVPIPPVFLNEDEFGKYSVIDGKQRLTAINEFMRGRLKLRGLKIFADVNGDTLDSLPGPFQNVIKTRPTLRVIIILRQSDPDIKYEVFQRLNTGGVKCNPQEIRNSAFTGMFNTMILEESESKLFHSLLHIKKREKSKIYQEMRDAELLLRFLTFRERWENFQGGMKKSMDDFASKNRYMDEAGIEACRKSFNDTLKVVQACFGEYSFRRWQPEKGQWRTPVLASLYDAEMFGCYGIPLEAVAGKGPEIQAGLKALCADDDFRQAIDAATNTPSYFKARIKAVKDMIANLI
jgi:hypothetical protein